MKKITAFATTTIAFLSLLPLQAFAADQTLGNTCAGGSFTKLCNLDANKIGPVVGAVVNFIFLIAAIIALFYLIIGGIKWVTSEGDSKNIEAARGQIIAAAIGLGVTFLAYLIINLLLQFFLSTSLNNLTFPTINSVL